MDCLPKTAVCVLRLLPRAVATAEASPTHRNPQPLCVLVLSWQAGRPTSSRVGFLTICIHRGPPGTTSAHHPACLAAGLFSPSPSRSPSRCRRWRPPGVDAGAADRGRRHAPKQPAAGILSVIRGKLLLFFPALRSGTHFPLVSQASDLRPACASYYGYYHGPCRAHGITS